MFNATTQSNNKAGRREDHRRSTILIIFFAPLQFVSELLQIVNNWIVRRSRAINLGLNLHYSANRKILCPCYFVNLTDFSSIQSRSKEFVSSLNIFSPPFIFTTLAALCLLVTVLTIDHHHFLFPSLSLSLTLSSRSLAQSMR